MANYINAYLIIDSKLLVEKNTVEGDKSQVFLDNTIRDVVDVTTGYPNPIPKYGPSRYDPILPLRTMKLEKINIKNDFLSSESTLEWIVFADNSEPRKGKISINEIKIKE